MPEFEERADQLPLSEIEESLADGQIFKEARKKLLSTGAKLLVGPRGTGKTHLMRYTYKTALSKKTAPIVLYSTFNRYLHLEPLLKKSPDALKRFHSWVIAKIIVSAFEYSDDSKVDDIFLTAADEKFNREKLNGYISLTERGGGAESYEAFGQYLTIDDALKAIRLLVKHFSRERAVLLLDDAALSLSDQYLEAFFQIFRLLKAHDISPKASVYPGSTQYGPTFHASHEVQEISLWLSVEDPEYSQIMGDIASRRFSNLELQELNPDVLELFKYISFGIPRALLRLLREYMDTQSKTVQTKVNKIIDGQTSLVGAEYDSLALKLKQFSSLIKTGRKLFDKAVEDVSSTQSSDLKHKNFTLGIRQENQESPLLKRMIRFLIEVGLLYPLSPVSHGTGRKYDRYILHFAFLYQAGAFKEGKKNSLNALPILMNAVASKHPIRRDLDTLLLNNEKNVKLDLPPCQNCGIERINESQRFCHNCGESLVESSLFEGCMSLSLDEVPNVSAALIARINTDTPIRTIGDIYGSQNASGDLQRATYVGPIRANHILSQVAVTVEEFLS